MSESTWWTQGGSSVRRRSTTILSVLAVATTLTACSDAEPSAHDDVASLSSATREAMADAGSARLEFAFSTGDEPTSTGRCLTTVPDSADESAGTDFDFDCVFAGHGRESRFIAANDFLYVEVPPDQLEADQRPWLRVDPTTADPLGAQFGGLHQQAARSASLADALPAAAEITAAEPDTVGDVAVYRYELSIDVAEALEADTDEVGAAAYEALSAAGVTTVQAEVWVDADDLPLRQAVEFEMPEAGLVRTETDFSLWGEAHEVEVPPSDQLSERVPTG
ncbi:hypothetical protein [Actinoalloteichus hymeniacidonis]|uniref:LppX_LprAFG lipoprotein n=1 Tax=Actinoalloteichus hymeniacidonis TaxID=340345 RepID=A0AAC9HU42_9PSEU|nr:hypothetical protein [Actinoalloteichus hymeniacidonis]AOS65425.1 hypothetical protein TL08_23225 [Actinoalloteichus hymeniacidonis]MBB5906488.1 hypothetical protein [Actinoalloteichus hymeniacidonis]